MKVEEKYKPGTKVLVHKSYWEDAMGGAEPIPANMEGIILAYLPDQYFGPDHTFGPRCVISLNIKDFNANSQIVVSVNYFSLVV
jgi:hypothetical protein